MILACNTASSEALREIQTEYTDNGKKVLGVLVPFAESAVEQSLSKRIGVIATEGTVKSNAYEREIKKLEPSAIVIQQACPRLVPLVESGQENSEMAYALIKNYLRLPLSRNIDTLILGCTHYGLLETHIREVAGSTIKIISERDVVPSKLREYLARHPNIEKPLSKNGTICFYTTGSVATFNALGSRFFGSPVNARYAQLL